MKATLQKTTRTIQTIRIAKDQNVHRLIEIEGDSKVLVADGADAKIIFRPRGRCALEIKLGARCRADCLILQIPDEPETDGSGLDPILDLRIKTHVGERSSLGVFGIWGGNGEASVTNILEGKGSEAHDVHILVQEGKEEMRLSTWLEQKGKNTKGDVLVRAVVKDSALASLDGMIHIEKSGAGAESFLAQQAILLDHGARAVARPELEIENNDVMSRHSASVAQIDEEKIFYLMSRGLAREDARALIIEGFLESAIERLPEGEIKAEASELLSYRIIRNG